MDANYLLKGLDSLSLNYTIMGNSHFMQNITPDLYRLELVTLSSGIAEMSFKPTDNVPEELRESCHDYTISVHAHKNFSLVIRTVYCCTVRYMVLCCLIDENGETHFHYDVLQKPVAGATMNDPIYRDTTYEYLRDNGFEPMERFDDSKTSAYTVVFENGEIK